MNKKQAAFAETDQKIIAAFTALGTQMPIDKISISDITRATGINRGTFYLHYANKPELISAIKTRLFDDIKTALTSGMASTMDPKTFASGLSYPVVRQLFEFVDRNRAILKLLTGINGDPGFISHVSTMIENAVETELTQQKGNAHYSGDIPDQYAGPFLISGIITIILVWINETNPVSIDEAVAIMMKTRFLSPYDLLGLEQPPNTD